MGPRINTPGSLPKTLVSALKDGPVSLTLFQLQQIEQHWRLVTTWNQRTNLTSISNDRDAALLHYYDSLMVIPYLPDGPVLDVGSGGGFPGIPVAVAQPQRHLTLMEPRRKRASFLERVVAEIDLREVEVLHGRVEDPPLRSFAAAITRATFSNAEDLAGCLEWVRPGGVLLALRTHAAGEMLGDADEHHAYLLGGTPRCVCQWNVPGTQDSEE